VKQRRTDMAFLMLSICGYCLFAGSFILMPVERMGVLPGLLFWGGLILGAAFQIVLESRRRAFFKKYKADRDKMQKPRNGLLSFASNKVATVVDCILAVSFVATVLAFVLTKGTGNVCYIGISASLFSFCMHCIFNGRNYFFINNQNKIQQALDQKKAKTTNKGEGNNG